MSSPKTPPQPVLKFRAEDFRVLEVMAALPTSSECAEQHYLLLRKRGFTTMEAVRLIADRLAVSSREVTYGGLKDEDGITDQLIAIPAHATAGRPDLAALRLTDGAARWIELHHHGHGDAPFQVGILEGNAFSIVVRNLDPTLADLLAKHQKVNLFFLNYYDTQRFGVPNGPKRTYLVGKAMLEKDWEAALRHVISLESPESRGAEEWRGTAEAYFAAIDPRTASFYLAAHASLLWNSDLMETVSSVTGANGYRVELEGLTYRYASSIDAAVQVMARVRELPYRRYVLADGEMSFKTSMRATVVQTHVTVMSSGPDQYFPERSCVRLNFFLPSGCYATTAMRQLLGYDFAAVGQPRHGVQ